MTPNGVTWVDTMLAAKILGKATGSPRLELALWRPQKRLALSQYGGPSA
jgi:hypothetical protein